MTTDDKRFGADGFDGDGAEDDAVLDGAGGTAGDDSRGGARGHDAAPDAATADPVEPVDADLFASELSAIFAAALADEPPSRVTAESVLREARGEKRSTRSGFGTWLVSGRAPAKWAGGLIAVAALVAAVIVVAPITGSSPDSASTAASGLYESASGSGVSESSAATEGRMAAADGPAGVGSADAGPSAESSERAAGSESSQEGPEPGAYTALSDTAGSDTGDGHDTAGGGARSSEASGPASPAGDSAAQSSPGVSCELPALTPEEWSAAVATLPSDVTTTRLEGALCQEGALRGNGIEVDRGAGKPGAYVWLVVSQAPIGRNGAATDSTVVSASSGDRTVTLIANQGDDPWLDEAALQRVVDAVADAHG